MQRQGFGLAWDHIRALQGQTFYTKRRLPVTYKLQGDVLLPSRTNYQISRVDFEKAHRLGPLDGPGVLNQLVRGPA